MLISGIPWHAERDIFPVLIIDPALVEDLDAFCQIFQVVVSCIFPLL